MALVVFMRAVNIGGHQTFKPSKLASELAEYDVTSIGAAGTFVVRSKVSEAALRKAIVAHLDFAPEIIIVPSAAVEALAALKTFAELASGVQRYVTVMTSPLLKKPRLPISVPDSEDWDLRIAVITGQFALTYRRSAANAKYYPNEIIEKRFGLAATTRNWTTITKIHDILASR